MHNIFFVKLTDESRLLADECYMKTCLKLQTSGKAEKIHNVPNNKVKSENVGRQTGRCFGSAVGRHI